MRNKLLILLFLFIIQPACFVYGQSLDLLDTAIHLRSGELEWQEFEEIKAEPSFEKSFRWQAADEAFLEWTQYDVKQNWDVSVNGTVVGKFVQDENRMTVVVAIPTGVLVTGDNKISIQPSGKILSDDIVLESLWIRRGKVEDYLHEATLRIKVLEKQTTDPTPTRITLTRLDGALAPHGLLSGGQTATRIGTIYDLSGDVQVPVPAGRYRIYAGRGFEYSLAQVEVEVGVGEVLDIPMEISRVVDTSGFVACDTHIHTLTHSGHGDATLEERMVTLAAEGIELAIATDHNKYVDYEQVARELGARRFFTPVVGCEVTTPRGHFNVFPISKAARPISYQQTNWKELFEEIRKTPDVGVVILNHARDLHSGVRPFSIENHFAIQGENAVGWHLGFNAMEVLNSAATQSELLQLTHDWMALLNSGKDVVPIGCSDSHDVSRHFVGQARTYIRGSDEQPDALDVVECTKALRLGRAMVSYGVFVRIKVEDEYESGELAVVKHDRPIKVVVEAQTPHWLQANHVHLYVNGDVYSERVLETVRTDGLSNVYREIFELPVESHDTYVVAVVTGPGCEENYWRFAKPYQPTSTEWQSRLYGCSGAVWLDRDHDKVRSTARDYAISLIDKNQNDLSVLLEALGKYDRATAVQVFSELHRRKRDLGGDEVKRALGSASETIKAAYRGVLLEIRNHALTNSLP